MLPGKTHPRETHPNKTHPNKTHPTSPRGGRIIWVAGRAEAGGRPGASCLSHAACTQVPQLPQPSCPSLPVGTRQQAPSSRATHSSKHSCSLLGPLCRKPLTQPSESAAAPRHLPSLTAEQQWCLSKDFTLSHGDARAGASSQRDVRARGEGHLSHSQASDPKVTCLQSAHRGQSRAQQESHQDHAGPPGDRSRGSLAVSSPCIAREHNVLLNELQF